MSLGHHTEEAQVPRKRGPAMTDTDQWTEQDTEQGTAEQDTAEQDTVEQTEQDTAEQSDPETAAMLAEIAGYEEAPPEVVAASTPTRKRGPKQRAMDEVAAKAYAAWVAKDRPTVWAKLPVITYYLDPETVADWRSLIKKACEYVTPVGDATGVRVRYGRDEFTLTTEMAEKIGKPDKAGKTVLSWAAVDKRKSTKNGTSE